MASAGPRSAARPESPASAPDRPRSRTPSTSPVRHPRAAQQVAYRQNLQLAIRLLPQGRFIVAGRQRRLDHGLRRRLQCDEQANRRTLLLQHADEFIDDRAAHLARLHLHDDLARLRLAFPVLLEEVDDAVYALVRAFLALARPRRPAHRLRAHQRQRPPLELIATLVGRICSQFAGAGFGGGLADDRIVRARDQAEHIKQAILLKRNAEVGDVDADPAAPEFVRGGDGGAAAAEGIQHDIAFVRRRADNTLQQGQRLLRRVAKAFPCSWADRVNVSPHISSRFSRSVFKISFYGRNTCGLQRPVNHSMFIK